MERSESTSFSIFPFSSSFWWRSEEHTSELQSQSNLVCRLLLEKKKIYSTLCRRRWSFMLVDCHCIRHCPCWHLRPSSCSGQLSTTPFVAFPLTSVPSSAPYGY